MIALDHRGSNGHAGLWPHETNGHRKRPLAGHMAPRMVNRIGFGRQGSLDLKPQILVKIEPPNSYRQATSDFKLMNLMSTIY